MAIDGYCFLSCFMIDFRVETSSILFLEVTVCDNETCKIGYVIVHGNKVQFTLFGFSIR